MSNNGFSWSKILGASQEAAEAEVTPTPEPVAQNPQAFSDLPFAGFDERGVPQGFASEPPPVAPPTATAPPAQEAPAPAVQFETPAPATNDSGDDDASELRMILARIREQELAKNGGVPVVDDSLPIEGEAEPDNATATSEPAVSEPPVFKEVPAVVPEAVREPAATEPPVIIAEDATPEPLSDTLESLVSEITKDEASEEVETKLEIDEVEAPTAELAEAPAEEPAVTAELDEAVEEGMNWREPIVLPEPPKVSAKLTAPLPSETPEEPEEDTGPHPDDPIAEMFEQEKNAPAEPPPLIVPIGSEKVETTGGPLTTPANEMSAFKNAARDAGLPNVRDYHIDDILRTAVERKASDIHLTVGLPPMARIDGEVLPLPWAPLVPEDTRRLIYDVLNNEQLEKFERTHELDFGHTVPGVARFRFNAYMQRNSVAASMRAIPNKIPEFESLGLPNIIRDMTNRTSGLVLVTGPTGSGKSTTIATMIDDINRTRKGHIITIEDPIEYLHQHKSCMINQREMHSDTYSFHNALRAVLREDPDIILVGELRDLETIEAALTLAETGHLVFGTLHTRNAPSTIDRIIDVFPKDSQAQIRVLLSNTLEGVISQQLLPKLGGGRRAAIEIMIATPAIKNLIREGKTHQMYSVLETSGNLGMQTMDAMLAELYRSATCDYEECLMRAIDKETFARMARGA